MNRLKKLLDLWSNLSPEAKESILARWPWLLAFALGVALASYFGWCACTPKAEGAESSRAAKECLCSAACVCGCNEGRECRCEGSKPSVAKRPSREISQDWRTNGVQGKDGSNPKLGEKRITYNGPGGKRELSPEQTRLLLSQNKSLPDDSKKIHLTVIGSKEQRQQVRADLAKAPDLVPLADRLLVQDYGPEDWPVQPGFPKDGAPAIILETRRGGVLHTQYEYRGPAKLAEAIQAAHAEAIRRADPDRDPAKDPDLNKPLSGGTIVPTIVEYASKVPAGAWLAGGLGAAILILGRKK